MKPNITFISASAGSGKTHRVTEIIEQRLTAGACRPGGLVATTFTVKAAQELSERLRRALYGSGQQLLAERLGEALIGTVHSICARLLQRFAFEAGISPHIEILAEEEAGLLLAQSVEAAADFQTLVQLQRLSHSLGQRVGRPAQDLWKSQVRQILNAARANDLAPETFDAMAQRSIDELFAFLPEATTSDVDAELLRALKAAVEAIASSADDTKATKDYLLLLNDSQRDLERSSLPWASWVKLSKEQPAKASLDAAAPVMAAAARLESHPRLRVEIADYTRLVFQLACGALTEYQRAKEERGLLDFADLEQRTLRLLRTRADVLEVLGGDLDLLVVDEFQDTSPIQLALFLKLAECAQETAWVGDVKQAIYGFRSSDPDLVRGVVAEVGRSGTLAPPLATSYRATPELVALTNALFTPAFLESLGLPKEQVQLAAHRGSIAPAQAAVEFLQLSSGKFTKKEGKPKKLTNNEYAATVADGIAQLLQRGPDLQVWDRKGSTARPVMAGDVAVLCRTNDRAAAVAGALANRGIPVSLAEAGLLATPEARLAMACLRRLAEPGDTLATAEIMALGSAQEPEQWLEARLDYLAGQADPATGPTADRWGLEEPCVNEALVALERERGGLITMSPSEALDTALRAADVFGRVSAWGPTANRAAQRRANLESLRALAQRYEEGCAASHVPATIAGFLFWSADLGESKKDDKATQEEANAVHVSTYHQAKGLEWPVVVCTDFATSPRPRIWDVTISKEDPNRAFSLTEPLANRWIRFWIWPFGLQETGIPLAARIDNSTVGQEALATAREEELRLLYVGLTRARDLLGFALEKGQPSPWLESLRAGWLSPEQNLLALPDGKRVPARTTQLTPSDTSAPCQPDPIYRWFPAPVDRSPRLPARITPSAQPVVADASVGRIIDFGCRLPLSNDPHEADLGDALHAILAEELLNPERPDRQTAIKRILRGFDLRDRIVPDDVIAMVDGFRRQLQLHFKPRSILVEVPFTAHNDAGQRMEGFIDLLLETDAGWVLIDHKSFPGGRPNWPAKALAYSGQLATYRQALQGMGKSVAGTWIHFAVGGGLVEANL